MTLPQLREIALSMEESEKQARSIEGGGGEVRSEVNSVSGKTNYKGDASARKRLQKFSNGQVKAIFAMTPKTRIFWKSAKGGPREIFQKSTKK